MPEPRRELRRVYVQADPATEKRAKKRLRAEEAHRRYLSAARELEVALGEVEQPVSGPVSRPDRRALIAEQAIADFCAQMVGLPAIRPA